jgi:hypothetical protein
MLSAGWVVAVKPRGVLVSRAAQGLVSPAVNCHPTAGRANGFVRDLCRVGV